MNILIVVSYCHVLTAYDIGGAYKHRIAKGIRRLQSLFVMARPAGG